MLPVVALLIVAGARRDRRIGQVAGLVLIGVGAVVAIWGVPHLGDPLILRRLKWSEYEELQQPGIYAIASGGILVVGGIMTVRWFMRRRD